jgi:hypothetical protein
MKHRERRDWEAELRMYRHILQALPVDSPNRRHIEPAVRRLEAKIAAAKAREK